MRSANAPTIRHARDPGERHLERREQILGNVDALAERRGGHEIAGRVEHARQERAVEAAEECVAAGERDAVTVERPQHRQHAEGDEHLHRNRQHVLRAHHAAVEQREARASPSSAPAACSPASTRCRPCRRTALRAPLLGGAHCGGRFCWRRSAGCMPSSRTSAASTEQRERQPRALQVHQRTARCQDFFHCRSPRTNELTAD